MADLFSVFHGRAKTKMRKKALITASKHKCDLFVKARQHSMGGFFETKPAEAGVKTFIPKKKWTAGYVRRGIFNDHT